MDIKNHKGFTLVELLVVVAIVGLLVGITLPAVNAVRDSARSTECKNNLRQLGLALSSYQSSHRNWPRAQNNLDMPSISYDGPLYAIRTWLEIGYEIPDEQRPVYHRIEPAFTQSFPVFLCPSDSDTGTSYRCNIGTEPYGHTYRKRHLGGNGAFHDSKNISPRDVSDGLSNTAAFCERKVGRGNGINGEDIWPTGYFLEMDTLPDANKLRELFSVDCPKSGIFDYSGRDWTIAGLAHTWYNHIQPPQGRFCDMILNASMPFSWPPVGGSVAASSHHRNGVNMVRLDGSVEFISANIDLAVWIAIGSRDSSESFESD